MYFEIFRLASVKIVFTFETFEQVELNRFNSVRFSYQYLKKEKKNRQMSCAYSEKK